MLAASFYAEIGNAANRREMLTASAGAFQVSFIEVILGLVLASSGIQPLALSTTTFSSPPFSSILVYSEAACSSPLLTWSRSRSSYSASASEVSAPKTYVSITTMSLRSESGSRRYNWYAATSALLRPKFGSSTFRSLPCVLRRPSSIARYAVDAPETTVQVFELIFKTFRSRLPATYV